MKSLDRAIRSSGGGPEDERQIRRHLRIAERRLGRKLFREVPSEPSFNKRQRVVRELDGDLKRFLLDWMDDLDGEGAAVMRDLVESMSAADMDSICASLGAIHALTNKLKERPGIECRFEEDGSGFAALRVNKVAQDSASGSSGKKPGMSLAQTIKQAAAIAWISSRLQ